MGWGDGATDWAGLALGSTTGAYPDEAITYVTQNPAGTAYIFQMVTQEGTSYYFDDT